jgi:hypothetical protein
MSKEFDQRMFGECSSIVPFVSDEPDRFAHTLRNYSSGMIERLSLERWHSFLQMSIYEGLRKYVEKYAKDQIFSILTLQINKFLQS